MKSELGEAIFAVNVGPGNTIALPDIHILDQESRHLDVAILSFPYLKTCGSPCNKRYFPIQSFPPLLPRTGEALSLIGYPGILRKACEDRGSFSPVGIGYTISSVSERQIILADEHGDRKIEGNQFTSPNEIPLGGFSGSPGYIVREDGLHFAGLLRAGSKSINDSPISLPGVIFLSPVQLLTSAGTLDRTRMPWLHS